MNKKIHPDANIKTLSDKANSQKLIKYDHNKYFENIFLR